MWHRRAEVKELGKLEGAGMVWAITPTPHPSHSCLLVTWSQKVSQSHDAEGPITGLQRGHPHSQTLLPHTVPSKLVSHPSPSSSIPHCWVQESGGLHLTQLTEPWARMHTTTLQGCRGRTGYREEDKEHGHVHCLFHKTSQLASQTQLEGF